MSFISKLIVDNNEHVLLTCSYEFNQPLDATGKPSGKPVGGELSMLIEADGTTDLLHWMLLPTQLKSGVITFYKRDAMARMQEIQFTDGICCDYSEEFHSHNDTPMHIRLAIAAKEIQIEDVAYQSNWAE